MEPASNVSVPLTVVMRTRSRVPEREREPAPIPIIPAERTTLELKTQAFDPSVVMKACPPRVKVVWLLSSVGNPAVMLALLTLAVDEPNPFVK